MEGPAANSVSPVPEELAPSLLPSASVTPAVVASPPPEAAASAVASGDGGETLDAEREKEKSTEDSGILDPPETLPTDAPIAGVADEQPVPTTTEEQPTPAPPPSKPEGGSPALPTLPELPGSPLRSSSAADAPHPTSTRPPPPAPPPPPPASMDVDLAPFPDFDLDAPPLVEPMEIDKELEIKPKDDNEDPEVLLPAEFAAEMEVEVDAVARVDDEAQAAAEAAAAAAAEAEAEAMEIEPAPEMMSLFQDIQDIQAQDFGFDLAEPEPEVEAPDSPLTPLTLSPLTDLPENLDDVPTLVLQPPDPAAQAAADADDPLRIDYEPSPKNDDDKEKVKQDEDEDKDKNGDKEGDEASERLTPAPDTEAEIEPDESNKRKGSRLAGPGSKKAKKSTTKGRKVVVKELGVEREKRKPQERTQPRARPMTDNRLKNEIKGRTTELQVQPCLRDRYTPWGKCVQCIAKVGGDSCRFRNYRRFPLDPETGKIIGKGTFPSTALEGNITPLPREFNAPLTEEDIARTEKTVAPLLVALITQEMRHVVNNPAITRPVDSAQHRAVCDFCAGTIFAGFFVCTKCGRDYCLLCERYMSDTNDKLLESPWPLPAYARPRLQKCSRGEDSELPLQGKRRAGSTKYTHSRADLQAVSRFSEDELRSNWRALIEFVLEPTDKFDIEEQLGYLRLGEHETELADELREWFKSKAQKQADAESSESASAPALSEEQVQALYDASAALPGVEDPAELGSLLFLFIDGARLDNAVFDQLWARGEPLVVDNVLGKTQMDWNPEMFIGRFGTDSAYVLDCQTETVGTMSVGQFFTLFGDESRTRVHCPPTPPMRANARRRSRGSRGASRVGDAAAMEVDDEVVIVEDPTKTPAEGPSRPSRSPEKEKENTEEGAETDKEQEKEAGKGPTTTETAMTTTATTTATAMEKENAAATEEGTQAAMEKEKETPPASAPPGPASGMANGHADTSNGTAQDRAASKDGTSAEGGEHVAPQVDGGEAEAPPPACKITNKILKIKDWPTTDDFSMAYPDLYEDFCRALPVPDLTARNGVLNLYSHFPPGATRPDIGPKMYNAFTGIEGAGGQGSTRMHMDVADAVNIMMYAADRPDGAPGCAVWDLFRAEDAGAIREFLFDKFETKKRFFTDPIHSQMFYLDAALRKELFESKGVKSFRVYQYPGQAVFIPAGCAHQVCNLADCIKIAIDFVSPHNVRRCQQLTQDFRRENFVKAWKDDVLQLYNVMWYAWTNVREIRARKAQESAEAEAEKARREARLAALHRGGDGYPAHLYSQISSVRDDPARRPLARTVTATSTGTDKGTPVPEAVPAASAGAAGAADREGGGDSHGGSGGDGPSKETDKEKEKEGERDGEKEHEQEEEKEQGAEKEQEKEKESESEKQKESHPPEGSSLIGKLLAAALERELPREHMEELRPEKHQYNPSANTTALTPAAGSPERDTSRPVTMREHIEAGHVPADLALNKIRSDLGLGGGLMDLE